MIADRVFDLGYVDESRAQRRDGRGLAYIQPSAYESFSRTIMEAWLAGTLVIATGASAVNRWHCDRSGAGPHLRRRRRVRGVPPLRRRGSRHRRAHRRARAAITCSSTTPGRPCSTRSSAPSTPGCRGADVRILMVSPYPPVRDGLANYAVQEVKRLRAAGHDVEVLSPGPVGRPPPPRPPRGAGRARARPPGPRLRPGDRAVPPGGLLPRRPRPRAERAADLRRARRGVDRGARGRAAGPRVSRIDGPATRAEAVAARAMFRAATRVTHPHRTRADRVLRGVRRWIPGERHRRGPRRELRAPDRRSNAPRPASGLGLPGRRASCSCRSDSSSRTRASTVRSRPSPGSAEHGCRLEVVGSLRVEDNEYVAYVDELRELVARQRPGVTLHEEYVSDAEFDVWIVACDALVLPYRLIWSSGVCERAALYHRPVIASRAGGLADQVVGDAMPRRDRRGVRPRRCARSPDLSTSVRVSGQLADRPGRDAVMRRDPGARRAAPSRPGERRSPGAGRVAERPAPGRGPYRTRSVGSPRSRCPRHARRGPARPRSSGWSAGSPPGRSIPSSGR